MIDKQRPPLFSWRNPKKLPCPAQGHISICDEDVIQIEETDRGCSARLTVQHILNAAGKTGFLADANLLIPFTSSHSEWSPTFVIGVDGDVGDCYWRALEAGRAIMKGFQAAMAAWGEIQSVER